MSDRGGDGLRGEEATLPLAAESDTFVDVRRDAGNEAAVGGTLSRYAVLGEVGRGAMGRVLRAYDPKLQREVALKEVWGRDLDDNARARLVVEARAMAKLSHPNVVSVFDVEEVDGRLVLVMEFVAGQTLRQWLTTRDRTVAEIVDHFAQAGAGLHAAHRADVLHRDFKPANVLVADDGTVKVTDFGIAKASFEPSVTTSDSGADYVAGDELTRAGTVVGTPRYMAPEQHAGESLGPGVDQYALCVALWEALCGAPPFSGPDMVRAKRRGPPPWPDDEVPAALASAIRRGLAGDPALRWPTMAALLQGLRTSMRPRRAWRGVLVGLGAVGLALLVLRSGPDAAARPCTEAHRHLTGVWDDATRPRVEAAITGVSSAYASKVWSRTARSLDAYAARWVQMHTDACEATAVRGEQSTRVLDLRMGCLHDAKTALRAVVEQLEDADAASVDNAHLVVDSLPLLSTCADVEALRADVSPPPAHERERVDEIRALLAQSAAARGAGRVEAAAAPLAEAEALLAELDYGPARTWVLLSRAYLEERRGEYDSAKEGLQRALDSAARHLQWPELTTAAHQLMGLLASRLDRSDDALRFRPLALGLARSDARALSVVHATTAHALLGKGDATGAERDYRRALQLSIEVDVSAVDIAGARGNLGMALRSLGKLEEAERHHRAAYEEMRAELGPGHPTTAAARNNLATVLADLGRFEEAERHHRRVVAAWTELLGAGHPHVDGARNNLAAVLTAQGRDDEAERELSSLLTAQLAGDAAQEQVATTRHNLAAVYVAQDRYDEAEVQLRASLEVFGRHRGTNDPRVVSMRANLGTVLYGLGRYDEARETLGEALKGQRESLGEGSPEVASTRAVLGRTFAKLGRYDEALAELRGALETLGAVLPEDHPALGHEYLKLARTLLEAKRADEALGAAQRSLLGLGRDDAPADLRVEARGILAEAQWQTSRDRRGRQRAIATAREALEEASAAGEALAGARAELAAWIEEHRP